MSTISEIKQRAKALAEKTDVNSVTPKEVGGIMYDLGSYGEHIMRNGGTLGIRKVYASIEEMEADKTNPVDLWGDPIKKGNLVVIYDGANGEHNNEVYAFLKPGWKLATNFDAGYAMKADVDAKLSGLENKIENINFQLSSGGGEIINVDLFSLPQMDCSLGGYNNEWYYESGKGKHKAIPVDGRKKVRVTSVNEISYLGFVTSAYNPPYVYGDSVPYCESAKGRIKLNKGVVSEFDIPSDCMYIILVTVDGAGTTIEYDSILLYDDISIVDKLNSLEKQIEGGLLSGSTHSRIKVMSWNIGHYCNGTGVNTSITNNDYLEKRAAFRNLFNKYAVDIIGLVEYSDIFNSSTGESAEQAIIRQYTHKVFGSITVGGYVCNGIVSSVEIPHVSVINFPLEYYAIETSLTYMGSKFVFCVAHLPWQSYEYNQQAIATLINRYANTDRVIIVGDFNVRADNDYDLFAEAGYVMANHGYLGDIITYPNESSSHILDNIIVKGGQILYTEVIESDLSDHYPIVADVFI